MQKLCGHTSAKHLLEKISQEVADIICEIERAPGFAIIQVGENPASDLYITNKKKVANNLGINVQHHQFDVSATFEEVGKLIGDLNMDRDIDGIIVQLPLPHHLKQVLYLISPLKDVDGLGYIQQARLALNIPGLRPCTPMGVMAMLEYYGIDIECNVCIVGRSVLVGQSLALMMMHKNATVDVVHAKTRDIKEHLIRANIVCLCAGHPGLVNFDMLKDDAIVIDIAITRNDQNKVVGDLELTGSTEIKAYSPVPGGVGPMTVASLMQNVVNACKTNHKLM